MGDTLERAKRAAVQLACIGALVLAIPPAGATVYKCMGERGVVVYQEYPCPIGRELRNFDTDPPDLSVVPLTVAPAVPTPAAPPAQRPRDSRPLEGDATAGKVAGDPAARKFIREGMSEAEVLARIGRPDATAGGSRAQQTRWSYLPASGDPDTVTSITFAHGVVTEVTRKVIKK